ncbi:hypothetical protein [Aliarcobacter butzleri]|uniref:Uncharacterized protein n=1 Tax=Aliarcobacter butzleri (strain RM4018) TaxID=367737 RepID=A8EVM6_ALIB4|nr:hypothetical protein [Aliarcobacter butzleri]ABV67999.1 hypothetical protein Abu_1753 [Aliarcobacter butzleri RM4018]MCR8711117.1 hypothetical protein [Aliarcobacter butzleri]MDS1315727.1 hypothetical protein [Aliarcobacter butzleri]SNV31578.1 Uncharacterised protein [Aliarcobacter butzleri]GGT84096.1 hypothetical protein GCM10007985_20900 [Aliarcobacter butzleri]
MFKQVKSAVFWYYLYKFRKRVTLIFLLLIIALFANVIYADIVEYLKLKEKLEYLEIALISKWLIIIFNIGISIYLILTLFKKEESGNGKKEKIVEKENIKKEKFTQREKEFLNKKNIRSKADILLDK